MPFPTGADTPDIRRNDVWDQAVDAAGNVYALGEYYGTINLNPRGPGAPVEFTSSPLDVSDLFLTKYNAAGELIWARTFAGPGWNTGQALALDAAGNVFVSGYFEHTSRFYAPTGPLGPTLNDAGRVDAFVAKLDTDGNVLWATSLGGSESDVAEQAGLMVDPTGSQVWVTGHFEATASFGSFTLTAPGTNIAAYETPNEVFVARLDATTGLVDWAGQLGGTGDDKGYGLAVDSDGQVYVTGNFTGTADLDPGPQVTIVTSAGSTDIFLVALNPSGGFVWGKRFGGASGDTGSQLATQGTGTNRTIHLQAQFESGTVDFGPGSGITTATGKSAIVDFTAGGTFLSAMGLGAYISGFDFDDAGNVYTTGGFLGTVDFDAQAGVYPLSNAGPTTTANTDVFVAKYDANRNLAWARRLGGSLRDYPHSLTFDGQDSVYVTGGLNRSDDVPVLADFPTGDVLTTRGGFLLKLTELGDRQLDVGTVSGLVFHDLNGNGANDDNGATVAPPVPAVYADLNQNGTLDAGEPQAIPHATGLYSLNGLGPGTYVIRQAVPAGWTVTAPAAGYHTVTVDFTSGTDPVYPNKDFGDLLPNPTKFYVVNDDTANRTYEYTGTGGSIENYAIHSGNSSPRGIASTAAGNRVWIVDANRKVYVYDTAGVLVGSWTAGSMASNATPEGITTDGNHVWIVDSKSDKVFKYNGAATRVSGSQNASSSFTLNINNRNPKDLVTDGTSLWVVNDGTSDRVFKYTISGSLIGNWYYASGGFSSGSPTGITIDPSHVSDVWILDSTADRVFRFAGAASRTSGSATASDSFPLASGNSNPQGIADPPPPGSSPSSDVAALAPAAAEALATDHVLADWRIVAPGHAHLEFARGAQSPATTAVGEAARPVSPTAQEEQPDGFTKARHSRVGDHGPSSQSETPRSRTGPRTWRTKPSGQDVDELFRALESAPSDG